MPKTAQVQALRAARRGEGGPGPKTEQDQAGGVNCTARKPPPPASPRRRRGRRRAAAPAARRSPRLGRPRQLPPPQPRVSRPPPCSCPECCHVVLTGVTWPRPASGVPAHATGCRWGFCLYPRLCRGTAVRNPCEAPACDPGLRSDRPAAVLSGSEAPGTGLHPRLRPAAASGRGPFPARAAPPHVRPVRRRGPYGCVTRTASMPTRGELPGVRRPGGAGESRAVPRSSGGSRSRGAGPGPVPRRRARRRRRRPARRTPGTGGSSINRHGRAASSPGGAKARTPRSSSSVKTNTPKGRCPASRPETRRGQDRSSSPSSGPAPGSTARTAGQATHPPRTTGPGSSRRAGPG